MQDSYFFCAMDSMETRTLQEWLRNAQVELQNAKGSKRTLLLEGIRCSAYVLLARFREWKQTLGV